MKATEIVRRIDDLGRVVIPKEIRRTMRIRKGGPLITTLTQLDRFCLAIHSVAKRYKEQTRGISTSLVCVVIVLLRYVFEYNHRIYYDILFPYHL